MRKRREGRGKVKERVKDRKEGEGFPLPIGESGSGDGGGEEGRRARTGFRVGRPGTSSFHFKHCTIVLHSKTSGELT